MILVTGHRRESFGKGLAYLCGIARNCNLPSKRAKSVYPIHLNPQVKQPVRKALSGIENI